MNWRAIGCGTLALAVFLAIGAWGILRATGPADCPDRLPYEPVAFAPVGAAVPEPRLDGVDEPLVEAGTVGFGLASWTVYVAPGEVPAASGGTLPARIVLECGDGFRAYERSS